MPSKYNIGIHLKDFLKWNGGIDFIENIITALASLSINYGKLHIILLIEVKLDPNCLKKSLKQLKSLEDVDISFADDFKYSIFQSFEIENSSSLIILLNRFTTTKNLRICCYHDRPWGLKLACIRHRINMILPTLSSLNVPKETKVISYIYDLQHIHYQKNFTKQEIIARDNLFQAFIEQSYAVLCNSNYTSKEIKKNYNLPSNQKILTLPFAPFRKSWWKLPSRSKIHSKYNITSKYLIVSNQFWLHKNNILALKAFICITKFYPSLSLIFTGELSDYRSNNHIIQFKKLLRQSSHLDVKLLGMVPKLDQLVLIKNAELLIQPTTYEGGPGGGSVYDAMAFGTPIVLSDIEINQECKINDYPIFYFKNNDPESLAKQLNSVLKLSFERKVIDNSGELVGAFDSFFKPLLDGQK